MTPHQAIFAPATEIATALRSRQVSATEMVEASLRQIEHVNPSINAVVQLAANRARAEAKSADNSNPTKPLHGVPITLKDSIDTAGIITTYGTTGRRNFVPSRDATVAARLRQAGAIVLGKTNTPEFTLGGECENPVYGKTFNPYKVTHTPGSSSGGSAAIVAAGGSAFEIGSDTGGSIREPANFCGLAGIKPTIGRVSRMGHAVPFGMGATDSLTTLGPIARSVDDLELILKLISGPDGIDPTVVPMPTWGNSAETNPRNLRIALYTDGGLGAIDPIIVETVRKVADALADAGAIITEAVPPSLAQASEVYTWLASIEGARWLLQLIEQAGTTAVGVNLQKVLDAANSAELPTTATILKTYGKLRADAWQWFQSFDAILCPVEPYVALPHGAILNMTFADMQGWGHMNFYNLTGWPAGTVRAGTTADGLPVGVQLVAHPWREDVVFSLLRYIEQTFGGYKPPEINR
ncbi:MAG: amidase [Candidatus Promineifilaceae bacterium]